MQKPGFTLLETLFALAIVALMVPALYTVQTSVLRSMVTARQEYDRLCQALYIWQEGRAKKMFTQEDESQKKEESNIITHMLQNPEGDVKIETILPSGKSALASFKGVSLEKMTISWKGITGALLSETVVGLIYQPPKEERS